MGMPCSVRGRLAIKASASCAVLCVRAISGWAEKLFGNIPSHELVELVDILFVTSSPMSPPLKYWPLWTTWPFTAPATIMGFNGLTEDMSPRGYQEPNEKGVELVGGRAA